jgi:hypothetical protein
VGLWSLIRRFDWLVLQACVWERVKGRTDKEAGSIVLIFPMVVMNRMENKNGTVIRGTLSLQANQNEFVE